MTADDRKLLELTLVLVLRSVMVQLVLIEIELARLERSLRR